jgi:hypothetical protein
MISEGLRMSEAVIARRLEHVVEIANSDEYLDFIVPIKRNNEIVQLASDSAQDYVERIRKFRRGEFIRQVGDYNGHIDPEVLELFWEPRGKKMTMTYVVKLGIGERGYSYEFIQPPFSGSGGVNFSMLELVNQVKGGLEQSHYRQRGVEVVLAAYTQAMTPEEVEQHIEKTNRCVIYGKERGLPAKLAKKLAELGYPQAMLDKTQQIEFLRVYNGAMA